MGAVILISNTNVFDNIAVGATVGTLSVAGGSGIYTFTLTSNPGAHFATAGTNGVNLNTATALTAGSYPVTVQAAGGGADADLASAFDYSVAGAVIAGFNTVLPVISGTPQVSLNADNDKRHLDGLSSANLYLPVEQRCGRDMRDVGSRHRHRCHAVGRQSGCHQHRHHIGGSGRACGCHQRPSLGGKYYFQVTWTAATGGVNFGVRVLAPRRQLIQGWVTGARPASRHTRPGPYGPDGSNILSWSLWVTGTVVRVAIDLDNRKFLDCWQQWRLEQQRHRQPGKLTLEV